MATSQYKQLDLKGFWPGCAFQVRSETEEEVLKIAREHGCQAHGKCELPVETQNVIRSHIRNIPASQGFIRGWFNRESKEERRF